MTKKISNALNGLKEAWESETNMRIHSLIAIIALGLFCYLNISPLEFLFVFSAIFLVLICEIFNTSLERLCNCIDINYNENIKIIKDISAGATLLSVFYSIIVGAILVYNRLM